MLLLSCALALPACARGTPAPAQGGAEASPAAVAADSLRGTVDIVGSEPGTFVVLRMDGDTRAVTLSGDARVLRALAGLEVAVWGAPERVGVFRVERVAVRASGGVPAVDGVLEHQGAGWVLATRDGRRLPIPRLPEALANQDGARIWIAGALDRPDSFGIITPAP